MVEVEEKLSGLKTAHMTARQKLINSESAVEALMEQHQQEIEAITKQWTGDKKELTAHLKTTKESQKASLKGLKDTQKEKVKALKAEIKALERQIPQAERELKMLTNRGKLELILEDEDLIGTLKERWIAAEVAKRLDYPIFMAVSERGGKSNSGDYDYSIDEDGSLVEFPEGHPQEGQLVVNQDLVNYDLRPDDLADASKIPDDKLCIAEAFVRFAQEQGLDFWRSE